MNAILLAAVFNLLTNNVELVHTEMRVENGTNTWVMGENWKAHIDTGLFPIVAGRGYAARIRRLHPCTGNLWGKIIFHDADGYEMTNTVGNIAMYSTWKRDTRNRRMFTAPAGARYLRYFITCDPSAVAVLDALELAETDEKGTVATPSPEHPDFEVVVPARASKQIDFAADELRHWIKELTGKIPPLVRGRPTAPSTRQRFYLGRDFLAEDTGRGDSWLVTKRERDIYLVSNDDEGVVNAVFDLLERNTDIIFARADNEDGVVFSKYPDLTFTTTEFRVTPAFRDRAFALGFYHQPTALCLRRNYINFNNIVQKGYLAWHGRAYRRLAAQTEFGAFIPNDRYFKDHPEFYGEKAGTRRAYEHYGVQPCYTSREGMRAMSSNLVAFLKRELTPEVSRVTIGYGDTWELCRCANCLKPVTLPSGRILTEDDEAFRSRQFYVFAKEVMAEAQKRYPKLEFLIGGYLYAAVPPPEFTFAPMTSIMFCPYPKVCSEPVYCDDHNARWHTRCEAWAKSGAIVNIYEYYGNAFGSGRPGADMAQKDLIYWTKKGFNNSFYSEMPYDSRTIDPKTGRISGGSLGWDFGLMENWVMMRLFVDPTRDVEKLRDAFCRRAYREAAEEMRAFFGGIRAAWYKDTRTKGWGEGAVNSMNDFIRAQKRDKPLRELLVKALGKAQHPASRGLIRRTLTAWDQIYADAEKAKPSALVLPELSSFKGALELSTSNTVFSFYQAKGSLYVKAVAKGLPCAKKKKANHKDETSESFPAGDAVGFLLRAGENEYAPYYHFLVTPDGIKYDAKGYDYMSFNSPDFAAKTKKTKDGWIAVFSLPLSDVGINPTLGKPFGLSGVKYSFDEKGAYKISTTTGHPVHDIGRLHEVVHGL